MVSFDKFVHFLCFIPRNCHILVSSTMALVLVIIDKAPSTAILVCFISFHNPSYETRLSSYFFFNRTIYSNPIFHKSIIILFEKNVTSKKTTFITNNTKRTTITGTYFIGCFKRIFHKASYHTRFFYGSG